MIQIPLNNIPADTIASDTAKVAKAAGSSLSELSGLSLGQILDRLINGAVDFAFKVAIAIAVFYIGKFIISRIYRIVKTILIRRQVELSLATFILSLLKITLLFILIIIVIGIIGIETSSFIAIFASAGVAVGMALSGTLQNFAGGVLILLIKPYKVGDFIEVQGYSGKVKEIQIFYTIINTIDNKAIIIPNGSLSTGTINNFSKEDYRRVDWTVGISYGDDVEKAKQLVLEMLNADKRVVKKTIEEDRKKHKQKIAEENATISGDEPITDDDSKHPFMWRVFHRKASRRKRKLESESNTPEISLHTKPVDCSPFVGLHTLNSSSVDLVIRAWTRSEHYWDLYFDINEKIYNEFPKAGLSFPFPQMDVHLDK